MLVLLLFFRQVNLLYGRHPLRVLFVWGIAPADILLLISSVSSYVFENRAEA